LQKTGKKNHPSLLLSTLKLSLLFLTLAAIGICAHLGGLQDILEPAWADAHLRNPSSGTFTGSGILLYVALVALLSPIGVPRQALSALGGYAFGALPGTIFSSIGLIAGCTGSFLSSRLLARSLVQRRFGKRVQRLDAFVANNPFAMTIAIRCFPAGNNALTNLAAGVTAIPALAFIGGSAIGYLPQTIIFALLGSGMRIDPSWRILLSAVLFMLSTLLGFVLYRRFTKNQPFADE
jgi:uncharacterized membrane protein YdjX (TVP38/TMEM64 family)